MRDQLHHMNKHRRKFIKTALTGAATISVGGILPAFSAQSYRNIVGSNERLNVGVMGVYSRGLALAKNFSRQSYSRVIHVCDVDSRAMEKCAGEVNAAQKSRPSLTGDFRKALEDKQVDALVIAAPDHWHAPAALLASAAGKHVYVEKPCSHNPNEGELLVQAAKKYRNVIQMGNQRRSWPNVIAAIKEVHSGAIGKPYFAKTWYTANREAIGKGKQASVPSWLNYDLWQGPAPRTPYIDNRIHYNWHWFWNWGTGESCNNGIHMVDLARWGLQADYPTKVSSLGGRYHFTDDWQTPDTQIITVEYGDKGTITWEGRSCNGTPIEGTAVGIIFYGETGSLMIDGNGYTIRDLKNALVKDVKDQKVVDARNVSDPSQDLDALHLLNFYEAIRSSQKQHSDIENGHKSTLLCQLGNIAHLTGRTLHIDPSNGHIKDDKDALSLWKREYEKGWEPKV